METNQIFPHANNEGISLIDTAITIFISSLCLTAVMSLVLVFAKCTDNVNCKIENVIHTKNETINEYIKKEY